MAGKPIHVIRAQAGLDIQPLVQGLNQASQRVKQFATESKQAMDTSGASTLDTLRMLGYSGGKNAASIPGGPSPQAKQAAQAQQDLNDQMERTRRLLKENERLRQQRINTLSVTSSILRKVRSQQEAANSLEQQAALLKRSLMSAEDAHAGRILRYSQMLQKQQISLRQYNAAVQQSVKVMQASRGGFGAMSGAMTQASFAVEDFLQVMTMGGGLNMALQSASNNLTMVMRSLPIFQGLIGSIATATLPIMLLALSQYVMKMFEAKEKTRDLADELSQLRQEMERVEKHRKQAQTFEQEAESISQLETSDAARQEYMEGQKQVRTLEQDVAAALKNSREEMVDITAGYQDMEVAVKSAFESQRNQLKGLGSFGATVEDFARIREEEAHQVNQLKDAYDRMNQSMREAETEQQARAALSIYHTQLKMIKGTEQETARIGALLTNPEAMKNFQELFNLQTQLKDEQNLQEQRAERHNELLRQETAEKQKQAMIEQQRLQARQKEELFLIRATDEERERFGILKDMLQFSDIDSLQFQDQMTQQQFMASQQFLQAQIAATQRQLQELESAQDSPTFRGRLEQDAFQAQADAFKQVFEAKAEKPNPQIDQTNRKLDTLIDLQQRLPTTITVVP